VSGFLLLQAGLPEQEPPVVEFYQDFRGAAPPLPQLDLFGPNVLDVLTFDEQGARITLPGNRPPKQSGAVGIGTLFPVTGDFEITAGYELLSAEQPSTDKPVGIALTVQTDARLTRFARVGRFFHYRAGSVYWAEAWNKEPPASSRVVTQPTEVRRGKLRLVRQGAVLSHLVADAGEDTFRELYQWEFGTNEVIIVRLLATNYDTPVGVDARLVDLRIRARSMKHDPAAASMPRGPRSRGWLALALLASPAISFACSHCGKNLRARANLAGKTVRCPQCGNAALVEKPA
jgi:hypothetical protein